MDKWILRIIIVTMGSYIRVPHRKIELHLIFKEYNAKTNTVNQFKRRVMDKKMLDWRSSIPGTPKRDRTLGTP